MKTLHVLALSAAMAGLVVISEADAQQRAGTSVARITPRHHGGMHGGFHGNGGGIGGVFIVEREVPVIVEAPPPPAAVPSPKEEGKKEPPRKPYVIGNSYASLPGGCMKMIEGGVSYYFCGGGEWYRQVGGGKGAQYKAVAKP
jgi:hypothetical protein